MPGLLGRLFGIASKGAAPDPPSFSFELPSGWVAGHGPMDYVDALVDHARAYPGDHDRAFELMGSAAGAEGYLFMAGAVRGPRAGLSVTADPVQPGGVLSLDDELDVWVQGNLDVLATDDGVVGDPIVSNVGQPYPGRELRWRQSFEGLPPTAYVSYCYATAGFVWTLAFDSFDPEIGSAPGLDATFRAIAKSFRVIQPGAEGDA